MKHIHKEKKQFRLTALLLALIMLLSLCVPVAAANSSPLNQEQIQTALPSASGVYVSGLSQDAEGNTYIMGTATGRIAETDPISNVSRIFIAKFGEDLEHIRTEVVLLSEREDLYHNGNPATGYVFATQNSTYEIYSQSLYNGAMAIDGNGDIYVALRNSATKSLKYSGWGAYEDLYRDFSDCTCDEFGGMLCDDDQCDEDERPNCPVCSAYRAYIKTFVSGASVDLILCKIDGADLSLQKKFVIGSDLRSGVTNDSRPRAYDISFDGDGNIYVSGCTGADILTDPVYGFDDFSNNKSAPHKELTAGRGFLVKIDPAMETVVNSTYFAGPSAYNSGFSNSTIISRIAVDGDDIYISGQDCGGKLPGTAGAAFPTRLKSDSVGGTTNTQGFVAKLHKDDFTVGRTTYLGGSDGSELVNNLIVKDDAVYLAGTTTSVDMQTGENAFRRTKSGSYQDIYMARLSKDLSADGYLATYFGSPSSRNDQFGLDVDAAGNFYITGETYSGATFPTLDGSSAGRIYVSKLDSELSTIMASTLIHNTTTTSNTQGRGIKVLPDGSVVVAGQDGGTTAFVEKFSGTLSHGRITGIREARGFTSANKYLGIGDELNINVSFSTMTVVDTTDGTPTLALNLKDENGDPIKAVYASGSGTKQLTFTYTIKAGDTTNGSVLNCAGPTAIALNGGSILPASGGDAGAIDLTVPTTSSDLPYDKIYINTTSAAVRNVTSAAADAVYSNGAIIPITVEFDEEIASVTGPAPTLELNSGGIAVFDSIYAANKRQLIFRYTVGADDAANKLDYAAADSLKLNGTVIKDNYGNNAVVDLPAPGGAGSLSVNKNIVVDSTVPYIVSVSAAKEAGYYKAGEQIPIEVKFSGRIDKVGVVRMSLGLSSGAASLSTDENVTDSDTLTFLYTVAAGHNANPLNFVPGASLVLDPGAAVKEHSGTRDASLFLPQTGKEGDLGSQGIVIDTTAPTGSGSLSVLKNTNDSILSGSRYYKAGDRIGIRVPVNEVVTVRTDGFDALPTVKLNYMGGGGTNKVMTYDSSAPNGTTGTYLYFYYEVQEDDALTNGRLSFTTAADWKITFAAGQITDLAGNDLNPALYLGSPTLGIYAVANVYFDNEAPVFSSATPISAAYNADTEKVDINWVKPTDACSGLANIYIGRRVKGNDAVTVLADYAGSASTVSFADETVIAGTTYIYMVYAADNAGNVSGYLLSGEVTIPGEPPEPVPPAWASGASLMVERLSSTSAKLSWNTAQVVDSSNTGLKAFKVYIKDAEDWRYIGQTDSGTVDFYTVENLDADEYEFKLTILNMEDQESENAVSGKMNRIDYLLAIMDDKENVLKLIYEIDLTEDELSRQHYSGTNNFGSTTWYGVTGLYLEDLLTMADVTDYTLVTFSASDGNKISMAKGFAESTRYYFGKDDLVDKKQVKPMISLWYTEYELAAGKEYELPQFAEDAPAGVPVYGETRLFFGQSQYLEINRPDFLKNIDLLIVDVTSGPVTGNPTLHGVTAGTSTIYEGDPIPADFPDVSGLTATDAAGHAIDPANITRTVTALNNPDHDPNVLSSDAADVYTVTYRVVDSENNATEVVRILIVLAAPELSGVYTVILEDSDDYTVSVAAGIPQAVIQGVATPTEATVVCTVEANGGANDGAITVVFVHYRGTQMLSVMSVIEESFGPANSFEATFPGAQNGDIVRVFVVDRLDGEKGSATRILYLPSGLPLNALPLSDIELPGGVIPEKVTLSGQAASDAMTSIKITDSNSEIVYFNGMKADPDGRYSFDTDLRDCALPLDVTVTCQDNIYTYQIVSSDRPVLDKIAVTTLPTKTAYNQGGTLDLTGMVITAYYSDGTSKTVTDYTTTPAAGTALNTAGTQIVAVSYTEDGVTKTVSFTVAVNARSPSPSVNPSPSDGEQTIIIPDDQTPLGSPFTDVKESDWFYDDVAFAYARGLMTGTSATLFSPNVALTRGMVVTVLYRMEENPGTDGLPNPFNDVAEGQWYSAAVRWSAENDIVFGYTDGSFRPETGITREQLVAILYRYCVWKGIDVSVGENTNILSFTDALNISDYAFPSMQWACGAGIITGKPGGRLDPQGGATRAEYAAILHRFLKAGA